MTTSPTPDSQRRTERHTPTPWRAPHLWDSSGMSLNRIVQDCQPGGMWKRDTADICYFPPDILNRANAAFIVEAVNGFEGVKARVEALTKALETSIDLHVHTLAKLDMIVGDEARDQDTFRTNLAASIEGLKIVRYAKSAALAAPAAMTEAKP